MRITSKQKEIRDAHIKAWREDSWSQLELKSVADLKTALNEGKTSFSLWKDIVERNVSITSQIMMSPNSYRYLSGQAKIGISKGFRMVLNALEIL